MLRARLSLYPASQPLQNGPVMVLPLQSPLSLIRKGVTIIMSTLRIPFVAAVLLTAVCGCATTELTNTWKDPQYRGGPVKKIMVVGISKQASVRRTFEDTFAETLKANGVEAVPSYTVVPEDGQMSEDKLRAAVQQSGAGAVLITRMVEKQTDTMVTSTAPVGAYRRTSMSGYYSGAWIGYYEPVAVQEFHYVVLESTLFVAEHPEPVWSGTTRNVDSKDIRPATEGFAKPVIAALKKEGLIRGESAGGSKY
jgi:hypothetical protein